MNVMRTLRVAKVTVNMGIGEGGERLAKGEELLEGLTKQKPIRTFAKSSNQTFKIRKGTPIACKVTLRKKKAEDFLKMALDGVEMNISGSNFDDTGNLSFGIKEHIDIPGVRYDPKIGIFGMDVNLTIERPGYRIKKRKVHKKKISKSHGISKDESIDFLKKTYKVIVEE
jgi:large subunit ribosomal protein L5